MAAGASEKLWEVSDIVVMLEQWELANFKPEYQWFANTQSGRAIPLAFCGAAAKSIRSLDLSARRTRWNGSGRNHRDGWWLIGVDANTQKHEFGNLLFRIFRSDLDF